jgi:hypothetical protein
MGSTGEQELVRVGMVLAAAAGIGGISAEIQGGELSPPLWIGLSVLRFGGGNFGVFLCFACCEGILDCCLARGAMAVRCLVTSLVSVV